VVRAFKEAEMKMKSISILFTLKVTLINRLIGCFAYNMSDVSGTFVTDKKMVLPMLGGNDAI
jgi:hypothetical protein